MWRAASVSLVVLSLVLAGCSVFQGQSAGGPTKPIQLVRCDANPSALCLQSFGLGQNELLITFYFPAAGGTGFYLKVSQPGLVTKYPCTIATTSTSILYCRGPLINLGTLIQIDLYTSNGSTPLAEGSFTLTDLALPTLPVAGAATTPAPGTAYPNPTPP